MCLINDEVEKVSDTKLFVSKSVDGARQITIYANSVSNKIQNNAMVLPVPDPDSVKFHDLSKYSSFFDDCDELFYELTSSNRSYGLKNLANNCFDDVNDSFLEVLDVGSYSVSLAKNLTDLKRVDTTVFTLSNGLQKVLNTSYSGKNMGFIICKLKIGNDKYHPLAYSHSFIGKLYIPTKHYHKADEDNSLMFSGYAPFSSGSNWNRDLKVTPMNRGKSMDELADDWDHDIYVVNYAKDNKDNSYLHTLNTSKYMWTKQFGIDLKQYGFELPNHIYNFEKLVIEGEQKNMDLMISVY